jgi:hypothetical protein
VLGVFFNGQGCIADQITLLHVQDELKEPELADALQPYCDKWRKDFGVPRMSSGRSEDEETEEGEDSDSSVH